MPYFQMESSGDATGDKIGITWDESFKIGRSRDCTLSMDDPKISSNHAQIRFGNGKFWIEDLESEWGTSVNGTKIRTKILAEGDEIMFGPDIACIYHTLPSDPSPDDDMERDQSSETVLDIDIDWEAYETEQMAKREEETRRESLPRLEQIDDGGLVVFKHILEQSSVGIGRSRVNDIVLEHRTASRKHCRIEVEDQDFFIHDQSSVNGVKVNGEKTSRMKLNSQDRISIGILEFRFILPDKEQKTSGSGGAPLMPQRKSLAALEEVSLHPSSSRPPMLSWSTILLMGLLLLSATALILISIYVF